MEQTVTELGSAIENQLAGAGEIRIRPWERYMARVFLGYLYAALIASIGLAATARKIPYFTIDVAITRSLQSIRARWFDRLMHLICGMGYPVQGNIWGGLLLLTLYGLGLRWEALATVFATATSSITSLGLLLWVNRPRPAAELVRTGKQLPTTSFPSGHVTIFTSVVGFLAYLVFKARLPALIRLPLLALFVGIVLLMGPARVYSGEHWASDVIAGYLVGSTCLAASVKFYEWGKPVYMKRHGLNSHNGKTGTSNL